MGETGRDDARHPRPDRVAPTTISVSVDVTMQLALSVRTADGAPVAEAIREAVIDGQRSSRGPRARMAAPGDASLGGSALHGRVGGSLREWVARQAANAPPLSACQAHVLRSAFVDGRVVRGGEAAE